MWNERTKQHALKYAAICIEAYEYHRSLWALSLFNADPGQLGIATRYEMVEWRLRRALKEAEYAVTHCCVIAVNTRENPDASPSEIHNANVDAKSASATASRLRRELVEFCAPSNHPA